MLVSLLFLVGVSRLKEKYLEMIIASILVGRLGDTSAKCFKYQKRLDCKTNFEKDEECRYRSSAFRARNEFTNCLSRQETCYPILQLSV